MSTIAITSDQLDQLCHLAGLKAVEHFEELSSTNDRALERAAEPDCPTPLLVLAQRQTAGRGRGSHRWESGSGGLTFSLVVKLGASQLASASLAAGLAVCEALERFVPGERGPGLKWPNDVLIEGRKVCGILVEASARGDPHRVVGVGINVNNSMEGASSSLVREAVSLVDITSSQVSLFDVLGEVVPRLLSRLDDLARDRLPLVDLWRDRCLLTGRTVRVRNGDQIAAGRCQGIDHDGALLIETDAGLTRCFAGTVEEVA